MRILFISDKFIPERGGSQIIFGHAYAHLQGHEVTVLTRESPGWEACDREYPHRVIRVPYSRVPRLRSPLLWATLARRAALLASQERFDQIHCGQTVETAPAGARLAAKLGVPLVVHTFAEDVTTYLRHPFYLPRMRRGLEAAAVVTSISRFTVGHLRELGVEDDRIRLLYPGVVPEQWHSDGAEEELRRRLDLQDRPVILTVSRLIPRKGQDVVLRALQQVVREFPEVAYVVVGGGPEEARLKQLAQELGVSAHVRWIGSIPNHETRAYYHLADLFVMPNRQMPNGDIEGFGLVFLEANACGKPVIGGRSGGTVDAIEHEVSGFLVEPTSVEDVAARLLQLLRDPEAARRMGEAGRLRVEREFTWSRTGAVLGEIVTQAAAGSGAVRV